MVQWLERASQIHEMYCHNQEVMDLNPVRVELGVFSTSVCVVGYLVKTEPKL